MATGRHETTGCRFSNNGSKQLKCAGLQGRDNRDEVFTSFLGRLHPPTTSRMATTKPSLKRSPGQKYHWRTWKIKWYFYIAHLKCWRIMGITNLVAFCPWDYWTLLQGDFLKILVISSFPAQYPKGILSSLFSLLVLTGYHHHLVKVLLGENWLRQSGTRIWSGWNVLLLNIEEPSGYKKLK